MKLGAYPTHRYSRSWITQRLINRAPENSYARKTPASVAQQLVNPIAQELQRTLQDLTTERYNMFISSANVNMMDVKYYADLSIGMTFQENETPVAGDTYIPPTVYADIDDVEYEITLAEKNNIETFWRMALPSRIADGSTSIPYETILPETEVSSLDSVSLAGLPSEGHVFITLKGNTNWKEEFRNKVYYPKIYITGITKKGTTLQEAIPFRYNGTFKSINEWKSIESIFASYLSSDATIIIESFPFEAEAIIDTRNIYVPRDSSGERVQFIKLEDHSWGSAYALESFTVGNMNLVRLGIDEREINYQIELLNSSSLNITANGFVSQPETNFIYVVDDTKFYVYDSSLPYPDADGMELQSLDAKIDIYSDKWSYYKDEVAMVKTRNNDVANVPFKTRWILEKPDGTKWNMDLDGNLTSYVSSVGWMDNTEFDNNLWSEQNISITLEDRGEYKVSIECEQFDRQEKEYYIQITKLLWSVPSITPEVEYDLPLVLQNNDGICRDSDGKLWVLKYGNLHSLDVFFDYYMVDYPSGRVWLRENYESVRIVP